MCAGGVSNLRVARGKTQKLRAPSLHTARLTSRAIRVFLYALLLCHVSIIARIRVKNDTNGTQLLRSLDLQAAENAAIASNDDFAFQVDAGLYEVLVILVSTVVGVHKLTSGVATGGIPVKSRNSVFKASSWVFVQDVLCQRGLEGNLPFRSIQRAACVQDLEAVVNRPVEVDVVVDDGGCNAPLLPFLLGPGSLFIG